MQTHGELAVASARHVYTFVSKVGGPPVQYRGCDRSLEAATLRLIQLWTTPPNNNELLLTMSGPGTQLAHQRGTPDPLISVWTDSARCKALQRVCALALEV